MVYPLNMKLGAGVGFAVANDAHEHKCLSDLGYGPAYVAPPPPPPVELTRREELLTQAEKIGIKVDKRWSDDHLADAIASEA